jgi:hypothetical protein
MWVAVAVGRVRSESAAAKTAVLRRVGIQKKAAMKPGRTKAPFIGRHVEFPAK